MTEVSDVDDRLDAGFLAPAQGCRSGWIMDRNPN